MRTPALFLAAVLAAAHLSAAESYRFSTKSDGPYARSESGRLVVDGKRWRIDLDPNPAEPALLTRAIGRDDGSRIAINDTNQTWYPLDDPFAASSPLFTMGLAPKVSDVKVAVESVTGGGDAPSSRIRYSYKVTYTIGMDDIPVRVSGEVRVFTKPDAPRALPWSPLAVRTGMPQIDDAFRKAFAQVDGAVWKTELEVVRKVSDGAAMRQTITRTIEPAGSVEVKDADFAVPATYANQRPQLGVPGR